MLWNSEPKNFPPWMRRKTCHWQHMGPQKEEFQGAELPLQVGRGNCIKAETGNGLSPRLWNQIGGGFKFQSYHLLAV